MAERRPLAMRACLLGAASLVLGSGAQAQSSRSLGGQVVDAGSGAPVALARVRTEGIAAAAIAVSDSSGRFRLFVPDSGEVTLIVNRLGYRPSRERIPAGVASIRVRLEPLTQTLETTIVTASRREERLGDAVVATEVIGAHEIARSGASDVAALLADRAGIQTDGGTPAGSGIALQGFGGQRVLVLLDGVPVVGRIGGDLDLSRIPIAGVERVEIIKGAQSTLYGSDAMGGVVNLVTRRPNGAAPESWVRTTIGSAGRREADVGLRGGVGSWQVGLDAGAIGIELAPGIASDAGTFARRAFARPRLVRETAGPWRFESSVLGVLESQRYRTGQLYAFADNSQINARFAGEWRRGAVRLSPTLGWSRFEHLFRQSSFPQPVSDSGAVDTQELIQLELPGSLPFRRSVADAGLAVRRESIVSDRVPGGQRALHSAEPYAQLTWPLGAASVTSGARLSLHERWGSFLAPRLALLWRPTESIAVRASGGRGYRAPDFKELYLEFANAAAGYAVRGNPDLRPERARSVGATLSATGVVASTRLALHATAYRDFIEPTGPDGSGTYTYRNVSSGTSAGIEWEALVAVGGLVAEPSFTWLRARDAATRRPLLGRAAHSARLRLVTTAGGIEWSTTARWTGRTPIAFDAATGVIITREEFATIDLAAVHTVWKRLDLTAGVRNLLDRKADQGWPGFTGRQGHLSLRASLAGSSPAASGDTVPR